MKMNILILATLFCALQIRGQQWETRESFVSKGELTPRRISDPILNLRMSEPKKDPTPNQLPMGKGRELAEYFVTHKPINCYVKLSFSGNPSYPNQFDRTSVGAIKF